MTVLNVRCRFLKPRISIFMNLPRSHLRIPGSGNYGSLVTYFIIFRNRIAPQYLGGLVVHPADVDGVLKDFLPNLRALGVPVYLMNGTVLWPSA